MLTYAWRLGILEKKDYLFALIDGLCTQEYTLEKGNSESLMLTLQA